MIFSEVGISNHVYIGIEKLKLIYDIMKALELVRSSKEDPLTWQEFFF